MTFINLNEVSDGRKDRMIVNGVSLSASRINDKIQSRIALSQDIGTSLGLTKGSKIDLQQGQAEDQGKLRLVPNPHGTYTVQTRPGSKQFFIFTTKLSKQPLKKKDLRILNREDESIVLELGTI